MYNINIIEYIQDMCLLHYNIIQWDSEESQLTYEVRLPFPVNYHSPPLYILYESGNDIQKLQANSQILLLNML